MKKITITLSDEAERFFNEIMYSLPKETDGSGMCTQSEAINYALLNLSIFENIYESPYIGEETIDIIENLMAYSQIHTVEGVRYGGGTHKEYITKAQYWLNENKPKG